MARPTASIPTPSPSRWPSAEGGQAHLHHHRDGLIVKGELVRQMCVGDLEALLPEEPRRFPADSVSKAQQAAAACRAGVQRVHIIDGRVDEGLLAEVFSNEGIGTLIYANEYQQIRAAKKKDVRAIQALTRKSVETDELVQRSRASIEKTLGDYYIFEIDRNPVACVALHVYPDGKQGRARLPLRRPRTRTRASGAS